MKQLQERHRFLLRAYEHVAMIIGLGSLAALCLTWLPIAMVLHVLLPASTGQKLGRLAIMYAFRFYLQLLTWLCACRFELSALDELKDAGPLIVVANHPSLLDAIVILSRLPNAVCVMKASLMNNPLFGAAARLARYIRNDGLVQIVMQSRNALQQGGQVLLFPEGTRTKDFPLNPCTVTAGLLAKRTAVPVQTVLIEFSTPYLGKQWPLFRAPLLPLHCRVRLGGRLSAQPDIHTFTNTMERELRQKLAPCPTVYSSTTA